MMKNIEILIDASKKVGLEIKVEKTNYMLPSHHQNAGESLKATKREPSARGYNWTTLFLEDINTGTWPSRLGESQMRVKYGHEFCGTSTQEWLLWQGPEAIYSKLQTRPLVREGTTK
jgi:hypothetical protein